MSPERAAGHTQRPAGPVRPPRARGSVPAERERILAVAAGLLAELGAPALTVARVRALTGLTPAAFARSFRGRDELLLGVFEAETGRLRAGVLAAYRTEHAWREAVRAALQALLEALEREPGLARFLLAGSLAGERALRARRGELIAQLAAGLARDAPVAPRATDVPETLVRSCAAIVHARLRDPLPRLSALRGSLMGVIVLPYLGAEGAREELMLCAPRRAR